MLVTLILDEFALWLNLRDVYWQRQGRESVDALAAFARLNTMVRPMLIDRTTRERRSIRFGFTASSPINNPRPAAGSNQVGGSASFRGNANCNAIAAATARLTIQRGSPRVRARHAGTSRCSRSATA